MPPWGHHPGACSLLPSLSQPGAFVLTHSSTPSAAWPQDGCHGSGHSRSREGKGEGEKGQRSLGGLLFRSFPASPI